MMILNNCTFIGNLVRDPELRYLPNGGTAITTFVLAINKDLSKEKRQEFESQGKPTADFPRFQAWGKMGETIAEYFKKGSKIALQARVQTGSYNADDGSKRYTTDFTVEKFEFVESRGGNNSTSTNNNTNTNNDGFDGDGFMPVDDDDEIPF